MFFLFSHISTRYAICYATRMGAFDEEELARDEADFEERWDNIHLEGILIPLPTIPGMTRPVLQYCQWQQATDLQAHQKKMVKRRWKQAQQLDPAAQARLKREWTRQQRAETLALYQTHQLQLEALDEAVSKPDVVHVVPAPRAVQVESELSFVCL